MDTTESLEDRIETLTSLIKNLNILEEENVHAIKKEDDEEADVIYSYSTDDENPFDNPYNNYGVKRNQSTRDEETRSRFVYGPPSLDEQRLFREGIIKNRNTGKWTKVPESYIPKISVLTPNSEILDLDCITNVEERIQEWGNQMGVQIQLTEELTKLQPKEFFAYITHKTNGNVFRFLETLSDQEKMDM